MKKTRGSAVTSGISARILNSEHHRQREVKPHQSKARRSRNDKDNRTELYYTEIETPIGKLLIASSERGLTAIHFPEPEQPPVLSRLKKQFPDFILVENHEKNKNAIKEIGEYFNGSRRSFSIDLDLRGTDFQKHVWKTVYRIPYGETRSYSEIACAVGNHKACRAVGLANKRNPIPLVIPCHRVIGRNGSMTGFGGGIVLKEKLLRMENEHKIN